MDTLGRKNYPDVVFTGKLSPVKNFFYNHYDFQHMPNSILTEARLSL